MRTFKQTTYNLSALTVDDLAEGIALLQEKSGSSEIIRVESEHSWVDDRQTGERRNTLGAVFVTVQEEA